MKQSLTYVLITPARNEGRFIAQTIESVIAQTIVPLKWVIVSDGSTDDTDAIVRKYASHYSWIELLRMPERTERHFAGKVRAFNAGYAKVRDLNYQVLGSLDADITLEPDYFAFLLDKLAKHASLGLVGTPFKDGDNPIYDYRFVNIQHVSGACQVFRRECFEAIGGYRPMKGGAIDYVAVISARMKGWKTRTFTEKVCQHHREMGTAQHGILKARFKAGRKDYVIGYHPLWQSCRTLYQMTKKPLFLSGAMLGLGYLWAAVTRAKRTVPDDMVEFQQREQMERLRKFVVRKSAVAMETLQHTSTN